MKRRSRNNELTIKEKIAATLIAAACIPLFLAAIFAYQKFTTPTDTTPAETSAPITTSTQPPEKTQTTPAAARATPPEKTPANTPQTTARPPEIKPQLVNIPTTRPPPAAAKPPEEKPSPKPTWNIIYVIDDAGNNLHELEPFLKFPGPLTIAVLPGLPNSAQAARMVREAGKVLFLHQPMEAIGGADPGPGAIYKDMNTDEILAILEKNINEIGPVAGMNNHQGSLITQDEEIMKTILEFCRDNKLYFLDSRTTAKTVAPKVSHDLGLTITARNIFLDNERDTDSIINNIELGLNIAREKKTAIMIGHAWSPELANIISNKYPNLNTQGYNFLTISDIMQNGTTQ